ncbi:MAG: aminotransferase class V-fold PLP-dependent enzyme [Vicinamibacterales bacterium]
MSAYGRTMLRHWPLDPAGAYLNHGTVGATPVPVLAAQQRLRDEMERAPARFVLREVSGVHPAPWRSESRLREAIRPVAAFVNAEPSDLVFVTNVTTGMNAVLQSVQLVTGDEILITALAYGAVTLAARAAAHRRGATVRTIAPAFPPRSSGEIVGAVRDALQARTRLVVIDHVTAMTALVLPVAEIAAICRVRGVPVLVDGAHAPGSVDVDITALGVDYYAANLHKWALAPRSCGILWARPDRQDNLHHPIVSWGHGKGFLAEFEDHATYDPTCALAAPAGLALLQEWGWPAAREYMHALARDAARHLTDRWGTAIATPDSMIGAMVTVPLPARAGATDADATRLRLALLEEERIEVQMHAWQGGLWARVSCQIYNELADVERLADAVLRRSDG